MKLHLPVLLRKAIIACMLAVVTSFTQTISAATLTLGGDDSLSLDFADESTIPNLNNGSLQLSGDTTLQLSSCGEGDGKTYILLTGVSELLDAQGNVISLDSTNNAASRYFDTTQPGNGFWAGATLQLTDAGILQLVLHNETVKEAITITSGKRYPSAYQYYAGIAFEDISNVSSSDAYGGAIYGSTITLSDNGSVSFSGNTASSSSYYARGGAIGGSNDSTITLSNNGSVVFEGNTASSTDDWASGGAIYGYEDSTITLSNNGSVSFNGNTVSSSSSGASGGAISGGLYSTITLSNNESVTFSGNTASSTDYSASGGAIFGVVDSTIITLSNNGSVTFSGNTASSTSSSASGGAINGPYDSSITLSNNGSVVFEGNTASGSSYANAGAIYVDRYGTITLSNNGSVVFEGNTASSSYVRGGAIYGVEDSTITLSNNGSVVFEGNTASTTGSSASAYGGAIYGYSSTITLSNNGSVTFSGNTAESASSYAYGGAIYGDTITLSNNGSVTFSGNTAYPGGAIYGGTITLSDNGSVVFEGNTASASGGAISGYDGSTITLSDNGSVVFEGNTASSSNYSADGGAIYGGSSSTITLSDNESVVFEGNTASSSGGAIYGNVTLSDNESVVFEGNTASSSGGAIYGNVTLSDNESVVFEGNTASSGGAIYGGYYSTITLSNNGSVSFSGNTAESASSSASGGAIYAGDDLSIRNNDSVEFYQNAEVETGTYRLRSIYAYSNEISLSAAAGKSITFYDSVYIGSGATVNLNQDYTYQAEDGSSVTIRQQGDIIFTGKYTEQHLNDLLEAAGAGRTATAQEILNSRTTEVNAMTNLYGGRLRVEEGTVYQGRGITAMEGSGATVRVQNATLSHKGYDLTFNAGTTLELAGDNTITGNVQMLSDSNLVLDFESGMGEVYIQGDLSVSGSLIIRLSSVDNCYDTNTILLQVVGKCTDLMESRLAIQSDNYTVDDLFWENNFLVINYDENTFNSFCNGSVTYSEQLTGVIGLSYFELLGFSLPSELEVSAILSDKVTLRNNGSIRFSDNTVVDSRSVSGGVVTCGAAISGQRIGGNVVLDGNREVLFERNIAGGRGAAEGGAIFNLGNSISGNERVVFNENAAIADSSWSAGGAIRGNLSLVRNKEVIFSGNKAQSEVSSAEGGAIFGWDLQLNENESLSFTSNAAIVTSSDSNSAVTTGGAIYALQNAFGPYVNNRCLSICNNGSVLFAKNYELNKGNYRLRSIYVSDNGEGCVLISAAQGKRVEFRDSVYIGSENTLLLNADYTDAAENTTRQTGDIIFTGFTTEEDLYTVKNNVAGTDAEIIASRTTEIKTLTELYGGCLRVEDGAIYKGYGITATADSGAVVRLSNASLQHTGYSMTFLRGTGMSLRGINTSSGSFVMEADSTLTFDISADNLVTAVLSHTGSLSLDGSVTLNVGSSDTHLPYGQYKLLQVTDLGILGNVGNVNQHVGEGSYNASDFEWVDNTLCFNYSGQQLSELPLFSEITDTPVTPDEPEIPDTPVTPDEPEIPDTPVTPDEPEIPDTPVTPDEPEIPDTPVTPDEPEIPDTPVTPDEPEIPDTPVTPDEPEIPDTPVTPEKPEGNKTVRPSGNTISTSEVTSNSKLVLEGKGTLTLNGKVSPASISVNISKNLTLKGAKTGGALAGDGDLTKKGNGALTLNDGNGSWTGDTHLLAGTIKVKGTTSLGKGDVYVKGGTLNLASKAIGNDIVQEKSAAIKSGKKFTGTYTLENGELQKGSTLNIAKTATLAGGTVNGALSGTGKTEVTGNVKLGDKGKITTNSLNVTAGGMLTTSSKGLSMNSKASVVTVEEDASLNLGGKLSAKSLMVNDGTFKTSASKPAAVSLKGDMTLKGESTVQLNGKLSAVNLNVTDSSLVLKNAKPQSVSLKGNATLNNATATINGKFSSVNMTLNNNSSLTLTAAKPQNLTVKQNLTIGSGSALTLNGKLSAGSLTIKKDGMLTMSGSKPVTLKVKGALTLNEGSSIILNYSFVQGKTYKVLTFGSYSGSKDYYSIFGVEADDCTITNTGKALTLTVNTKWKPQTQQKAVSADAAEPVVATKSQANPVADALVQANWGQLEASRSFVNAMANRSMAVQLGNGERAVWASAIGASSRHSSAGDHAGADTNVSGGAFGLETQVGRASLLGMALGNSWTRVSAHGFGTIEQDTTHLGIYGQTNWRSGVTADWSAAYGRSDSETMGSDWSQKHLQLDGRVSYNHELYANTVLSPFAGMQYYASDSATVEGTDTGSLQNLRAEIGVAASRRVGKFGVYGEIALHQDIARNNPSVSMEDVRYNGMNPGRTGLNFTVGASYELSDKWSVNASYTGEFVETANAHSANVGATYKF